MKITTRAHYGLNAMCELAHHAPKRMSVREIAELLNCSNSYMEEIFGLLKEADLIQSVRGAHGGYYLSRGPENISLADIIRATEGPIGFTECSGDKKQDTCALYSQCHTKNFWDEFYQVINSYLEQKKLSEIINPEGNYGKETNLS